MRKLRILYAYLVSLRYQNHFLGQDNQTDKNYK